MKSPHLSVFFSTLCVMAASSGFGAALMLLFPGRLSIPYFFFVVAFLFSLLSRRYNSTKPEKSR